MHRIVFILWAILTAFATAATAERELHGVGIYEGYERSEGQYHGPRANVHVDRPGKAVTLFLTSYEKVTWIVTTSPGTSIENIFIGGYNPENSAIVMNDIPFAGTIAAETPFAYKNEGTKFRDLVTMADDFGGFKQFSSFNGAYDAKESGFVVADTEPKNGVLDPDYLKRHLAPASAIPHGLQSLFAAQDPKGPARLIGDGFEVTQDDGTVVLYPVSLDVPTISWGGDAVLIPEKGALFGASYGGEGFLYRFDISTSQWSVLASMEGHDAHGIIYDARGDQLFMAGGIVEPQSIMIFDFADESLSVLKITKEQFVGITDLYDPGNGPSPRFYPIGMEGDVLLLRASPARHGRRARDASGYSTRTWTYNLASDEVQLVHYHDQASE